MTISTLTVSAYQTVGLYSIFIFFLFLFYKEQRFQDIAKTLQSICLEERKETERISLTQRFRKVILNLFCCVYNIHNESYKVRWLNKKKYRKILKNKYWIVFISSRKAQYQKIKRTEMKISLVARKYSFSLHIIGSKPFFLWHVEHSHCGNIIITTSSRHAM